MLKKCLLTATVCCIMGTVVHAEPMRTLLTKENRLPEKHQLEVGVLAQFIEFNDNEENGAFVGDNQYTVAGDLRFGLTDNLALRGRIPYVDFDPGTSGGDSENGLGDIEVSLEMRVFEDIFGYPWIIPHVKGRFDTASEDSLGRGEDNYTIGVSMGSMGTGILEDWLFILDVNYELRDKEENVFGGAIGVVWELSDQFALLFESAVSDEGHTEGDDSDNPSIFEGGFTYDPTDDWQFGAYVAGTKNSEEDVITTFRGTYTF